MKKLKIAGIAMIVLIGMVAVAGALFVRSIARRGLPDYDATVGFSGVTGEVVVYRDASGIPHVYAQNEDDLYRAVGYCMAQDRLWQMDLLRRVCIGRLSEIFGKDLVEVDLLMRSLRIPEKSRMVLERAEDVFVNALQAFADGVNQYVEAHQNKLPPEFLILRYKPEKWLPEHSLHLVGYMGWDLRLSWDEEVVLERIRKKFGEDMAKELLPDMDFQRTLVYPEFESTLLSANSRLQKLGVSIFSASNNWAVSGEKSTTGKPFLANDMHLDLNLPCIWYQMHQVVEGKLNVTGVALPGQPFVVAGHNERIAWGFTNVMVDNTDFYLEKLNPENPNQYELNGEWKEMEVRTEEIAVRGGHTAREELCFTLRGPIVSRFHDIPDVAISMRWIGNDYSDEMRTIYLLNRAKNWDEFKNAMRTFISVSQNTVYADVDGNIGLYCCAGVPIRKGGDSNAILPGWTDEFDWKGIVPFEVLPHSFNPEIGFVSSANNKTVSDDFPHYISRWFFPSYRDERIREMLGEKEMFSVEDFKLMHADCKSKLVEGVKDTLTSELEKSDEWRDLEEQAMELFSTWNGILSKTSPEASIFETFLCLFAENMLRDEMGDELYRKFLTSQLLRDFAVQNFLSRRGSLWSDDTRTGGIKETFEEIVQKSFKDTVSALKVELGSDPRSWHWGKIHRLTLVHPLGRVKLLDWLFQFSRGPHEVGGSFHTVCPYVYLFNEPFAVTNGASQRHIYSLGNWDESLTVIPTGVSGIPASPHYCDQTRLYLKNQYCSDYFSKDLVQKNARYRMTIKGK